MTRAFPLAALVLTAIGAAAFAGPVAFTHVNVVPMDSERVLLDQTVVVAGEKIEAIGPSATTPVPEGATIVDGSGRFLLPGLTDSHAHLDLYGRSGFGDAPLFLAHGVTTVFNLRGGPEDLRIRGEIREGKRLAPNLYTSGEFINEPRLVTPEDVSREVRSQAQAGYDFIKFHELSRSDSPPGTTTGLSREAYRALNQTARELGIPLVGHAALQLGFDATLDEHQSISHLGELTKLLLFPRGAPEPWLLLTVGSLFLIWLASAIGFAVFVFRRLRHSPAPGRTIGGRLGIAAVLASATVLFLLRNYFSGSPMARVVPFLLGAALLFLGGWLVRSTFTRDRRLWARIGSAVSGAAVAAFAFSLVYWVPPMFRGTNGALDHFARRCREADLSVMSTLDVYERGVQMWSPNARGLKELPEAKWISRDNRLEWETGLNTAAGPMRWVLQSFEGAAHRLARALLENGVPVLAGTDAGGFPWIIPGSSLHDELRLLVSSGFTPFQALRAATVAPAAFLHREREFGTVAPGQRADLLLVDQNPIDHLETLRRPSEVMVRGQWLPREALDAALAGLRSH